jgi:hypothetical protein
LLLLVLTLVFATGSLNYDLLHFGYLAFSLVFFRIRGQIMERGNAVLNYLRLYNFLLIIASLVYQAPAFEYKTAGSCSLPYDIWNIIGLYKYEYGEWRQVSYTPCLLRPPTPSFVMNVLRCKSSSRIFRTLIRTLKMVIYSC